MEIFGRACAQKPHNGVRRTRWAVIRNTYPELKSTTIKTWTEWFPFAVMKWDAPISSTVSLPLPDGTKLEMEVWFFPLDRPEEVGKLRSLELTGGWINEASEVAKAVLDMMTQRVGRFPAQRHGGPTWHGVLMDTNMPDDDHYLYRLGETERPEGWEFFKQPGGLIFKGGDWSDRRNYEPNPKAENIPNLPGGYEYYYRQLAGKSKDWIKVFVLAQYGSVIDGKPVYPEWNEDLHVKRVNPITKVPLILGFDFGLTPAVVIGQVTPRGQLLILDELVSSDMGIQQFARDVVRPHLAMKYPGFSFQAVGDPAGMGRADTDEKTCFMELAEQGIPCVPASSNTMTARREAVAKYLTKMIDGQPGLLCDPKADTIRRGFNGRYRYKRVQVSGDERYRDVPDKNEYSHPHDALQYLALYSTTMHNTKEWSTKIEYPQMGVV